MYKEIKVRSFTLNRLNQKLFSVIINTGKIFKGGWEVWTVFSQCFDCINIAERKFLVQSLYVKQCSLISLYIAHTLDHHLAKQLFHSNILSISFKMGIYKEKRLSISVDKSSFEWKLMTSSLKSDNLRAENCQNKHKFLL